MDSHHVQITTIRINKVIFWGGLNQLGYTFVGGERWEISLEKSKHLQKKNPTFATWDAENSMVMAWLVNFMEEDISANYMCYPTAKELWNYICQMYSDLGNQSQISELQLRLGEIRQGGDSETRYFNILKLWKAHGRTLICSLIMNGKVLKIITIIVRCRRITGFINFGRIEYRIWWRGRIIGRQPLPSIEEVLSEVWCEESRRMSFCAKRGLVDPLRTQH